MFYETGRLDFDKKLECHDGKQISKCWMDVCRYPADERTTVIAGTTYLFCIALTKETLAEHFWAVYPGCDDPKVAQHRFPKYLTRKNPKPEEKKDA